MKRTPAKQARFLQHGLIMLTQPGLDLFTHMPGSIVPNEHQDVFALRLNLLAQPFQKVRYTRAF
jgi:hypothetical protein